MTWSIVIITSIVTRRPQTPTTRNCDVGLVFYIGSWHNTLNESTRSARPNMKSKGQHRGHCQACGRVHVIELRDAIVKHGYKVSGFGFHVIELHDAIVKHGYKVAGFGFFNGICFGTTERPLEQSRALTDEIIADLRAQAQRNDVRAMALRSGELKPEKAQKFTANAREYVWTGEKPHRAREPVMVAWSDASEHERKMQIEQSAGDAESFARHARSRAASLTTLADRVHGQPLIDRTAQELARVNERKAKSAPIEGAYRTKVEQKRHLESLSRDYVELRSDIMDTYLENRDEAGKGLYYTIPQELHQWRAKHSLLVLNVYPEHKPQVEAIELLVFKRNEVKARPVIK